MSLLLDCHCYLSSDIAAYSHDLFVCVRARERGRERDRQREREREEHNLLSYMCVLAFCRQTAQWYTHSCHDLLLLHSAFVLCSSLSLNEFSFALLQEPKESDLSYSMVDYWGNFAHDLSPGATAVGSRTKSALSWPVLDPTTQVTMNFTTGDGGNVLETKAFADTCAFWDKTGYHWITKDL
jgi:hypothetical protein